MKIVFVYPNLTRLERVALGISYLVSYLRSKGHECELVDYTWGGGVEKAVDKVRAFGAQIVGFTVKSGELDFCISVARQLKKELNSTIIWGGVHPTIDPDATINLDCVDIICRGEGEKPLAELLDSMVKGEVDTTIQNLWFKKDGKIIKNEIRQLTEHLDELPFPERDLHNTDIYTKKSGTIDIIAGRGCPYQCTYCVEPTYRDIFADKGQIVRYRSVDNVLDEIAAIQRQFKFTSINFVDDVFTLDLRWLREFAPKYKERFNIPYYCNARIEAMREETYQLLSDSGCNTLAMGIESGSEQLRKTVLERKMTNKKIIEAFDLAHKYGLKTMSLNMVGIPYETRENIQETIELNRRLKPSSVLVAMFQPYPGTDLHKLCKEKGWLNGKPIPFSFYLYSAVSYPHLSSEEILKIKRRFRFNILRKTHFLKSLIVLFYDLNYERFLKFWEYIPNIIKREALAFFKG